MSRPTAETPRRLGTRRRDAPALAGVSVLAELLEGRTAASRRFIGGLIAGALVGAVVAGGQLVRRRGGRA